MLFYFIRKRLLFSFFVCYCGVITGCASPPKTPKYESQTVYIESEYSDQACITEAKKWRAECNEKITESKQACLHNANINAQNALNEALVQYQQEVSQWEINKANNLKQHDTKKEKIETAYEKCMKEYEKELTAWQAKEKEKISGGNPFSQRPRNNCSKSSNSKKQLANSLGAALIAVVNESKKPKEPKLSDFLDTSDCMQYTKVCEEQFKTLFAEQCGGTVLLKKQCVSNCDDVKKQTLTKCIANCQPEKQAEAPLYRQQESKQVIPLHETGGDLSLQRVEPVYRDEQPENRQLVPLGGATQHQTETPQYQQQKSRQLIPLHKADSYMSGEQQILDSTYREQETKQRRLIPLGGTSTPSLPQAEVPRYQQPKVKQLIPLGGTYSNPEAQSSRRDWQR